MRQRGWFVKMIRISGRKEDEIERLVRGDDTNIRSERSGSAIDFTFDKT